MDIEALVELSKQAVDGRISMEEYRQTMINMLHLASTRDMEGFADCLVNEFDD